MEGVGSPSCAEEQVSSYIHCLLMWKMWGRPLVEDVGSPSCGRCGVALLWKVWGGCVDEMTSALY